jgi:magnesium-transporting ATPase (P-type)
MFNITPGRPFYEDLWANKILFWTVVIGCASIPLAIYIPVFNSRVFYQAPISACYFSLSFSIRLTDGYVQPGSGVLSLG